MTTVWMTNVPSDTERSITWTGDNYQKMVELVQWGFPGSKVTFDLEDSKVLLGNASPDFDYRILEVGDTFTITKLESPY